MKLRTSMLDALGSDSHWGLLVRISLFSLVMLFLLGLGLMFGSVVLRRLGMTTAFSASDIGIVFMAVLVPMLLGLVLAEIPRGSDWLLFRLGVATFCRTGLPLLIVISVSLQSEDGFWDRAIGFLSFFYVCGFLASVWISIYRFRRHRIVPVKLQEVERAAV